jgi:4-amino-4-deoxy-L-arabinose transferase-like glycosyltransferase
MILFMAGILAGMALIPQRRYFRTKWFWLGAALAAVIVLPNLIWQVQHEFISLEFLRNIHERDVRIGRTSGFFADQFTTSANLLVVPLWLAGLYAFSF